MEWVRWCLPGQQRTSKCSASSLACTNCSFLLTISHYLLFYSLGHLYSLHPNSAGVLVLVALVSYPPTRRKRSACDEDKLDGAATWAALCLIFFIIINSPLSPPQESYLSLADVPLSVMNFLCPPTPVSGPPHLSTPRLLLRGGRGGRGEEIKKTRGGD